MVLVGLPCHSGKNVAWIVACPALLVLAHKVGVAS